MAEWIEVRGSHRTKPHVRRAKSRKESSYRARTENGRMQAVHRHRAERALGKALPPGAVVHHADGSRDEYAPLVICENEAYHALLHRRMSLISRGVNPNTQNLCLICGCIKTRSEFSPIKSMSLGIASYCKPCLTEKQRRRRAEAAA